MMAFTINTGDDLRVDLSIPLRTSVFGGQEKLRINHLETCGTCTGSGVKPGSKVNTCKTCRGSGVVTQVRRECFHSHHSTLSIQKKPDEFLFCVLLQRNDSFR